MATAKMTQPTIIRTERGLTLSGTRLTVYDIVESMEAGWSRDEIRDLFSLNDPQIEALLGYIAEHRDEVDAEYREVVRQADEIRRYWEARNHERLERLASATPPPGQEVVRARLRAWRERLAAQE